MVNERPAHPEQVRLEKKAGSIIASRPDPDRTVEEVFGPMEDWIFEIGEGWKLMLVPFLQRWWYFDRVHDDWQDTGCAIGEGVFHVEGGLLTLEKNKAAPKTTEEEKPGKAVPQRERAVKQKEGTSPVSHAPKFCVHCGSPLKAAMKFCPSCGAKILSV